MKKIGKLKERKGVYTIFSGEHLNQWILYYSENTAGFPRISEYINEYKLYNEPFEIVENRSKDHVKARFLCNNLEFIISIGKCEIKEKPDIPEHLFRIE